MCMAMYSSILIHEDDAWMYKMADGPGPTHLHVLLIAVLKHSHGSQRARTYERTEKHKNSMVNDFWSDQN